MPCQLVASGPVSASPSPTTQQTSRSGLSNAAPKACASAYPSSPPSWIDPGVSGATWLGIPPGNENWRNSLRSPSHVGPDVRVDLAVGALEIGVRNQRRPAVTGAGDVDRVEVAQADRPVEMRVDEVQPRRRAEVTEQPRLHVLRPQRLADAAGCRAGRSARPRDSSPRASSASISRELRRFERCGIGAQRRSKMTSTASCS